MVKMNEWHTKHSKRNWFHAFMVYMQASAEKQPTDYKWWAALSKHASAKLAKQEEPPIYGQLYCLQGTVPLAGVSMTTG